jgi:hypothetical protein
MDPISLSAYARHRGVTPAAVQKAVATGRLRASVARDDRGAPRIADVELADREWSARTQARIARPRPAPAPAAALIIDADGMAWTTRELLDERAGAEALAAALVRDALTREDPAAYAARIRGRLTDERAARAFDCVLWTALEDEDSRPDE